MEQVFDLRAFVIMIFKKCKLLLILAVLFGILGGVYGYTRAVDEQFMTTSSASINIKAGNATDATALTNIMTSVKDTVTGDYFYMGILNAIRSNVENDEFTELFSGKRQPTIAQLKEIIKVYVNGNLVLVDVTTTDEALSVEASGVGRGYVMQQLAQNINNIELKEQGQQTVNKSLQDGNSPKSSGIKFGILGVAGGIVLAVLWLFFFDIMDLKIKSADDLKKYNLPLLGDVTKN